MPITEFPGRGPIVLPAQFSEYRPHQLDAVNETLDLFASGVETVLLDAPTGAGKTLIGETVRILHPSLRGLYVCTTKGLQDQFVHDFDYAKVIKGKANYPTLDAPDSLAFGLDASSCVIRTMSGDSAPPVCNNCEVYGPPDLTQDAMGNQGSFPASWRHCDFCHPWQRCPYRDAKAQALIGPLSVANTAYFLAEANNVGLFGNQEFVIIDEADTLESVIMSFMSVKISQYLLKQSGIPQPSKKTVAVSWLPWATKAAASFNLQAQELSFVIANSTDDNRLKLIKQRERFQRAASSITRFKKELSDSPTNWVYDGGGGGIEFRPVEVRQFGKEILWDHAANSLLMSATLISPATMMDFLGFDGRWATVKVDAQFDPERRPVWVTPAANMTFKNKDIAWKEMVDAVEVIINRHTDVRILVHTVSYEFTNYLYERLKERGHGSRLLTYTKSSDRDPTLEKFKRSKHGVVLAPSFDRGVDLPGDEARVIVVTKVPFPSLGDKQVAQRLHGTGISGKTWYSLETIRSLVQMTGRGMRNKDDWCISYILDRQFVSNVWKQRRLVPKWWADSLKWGPPTNGGAEAVERAPVPQRIE